MSSGLHMEALVSYRPAVRAVVAHVLGARLGEADVDDCTSEAFRRALEGHARLLPGAPLRPWLLGIARHVALDARRARTRELRRSAPRDEAGHEPLELLAAKQPSPLDHAEHKQRSARLQLALAALPEEHRRALTLHADGLSYKEIATELSVPLGTVCTWIARSRQSLARAVDTTPLARQEP
jgi:RNA polymerase sigma factor (sigma-70 family)